MSNLYRGPFIDGSYQVSVHLAEGFQRRRLKCEMPSDGKSSHCLWQGELEINCLDKLGFFSLPIYYIALMVVKGVVMVVFAW